MNPRTGFKWNQQSRKGGQDDDDDDDGVDAGSEMANSFK